MGNIQSTISWQSFPEDWQSDSIKRKIFTDFEYLKCQTKLENLSGSFEGIRGSKTALFVHDNDKLEDKFENKS